MNSVVIKGSVMYFYSHPVPVPQTQSQFSRIAFKFDEDWAGRKKTVQFKQGAKSKDVLLIDDQCFVPSGFDLGQVSFSIRGDGSGYTIATVNRLNLDVVESFDYDETIPPDPDLYAQLISQVVDSEKASEDSAERAAQSEKNAKDSEIRSEIILSETTSLKAQTGEDKKTVEKAKVDTQEALKQIKVAESNVSNFQQTVSQDAKVVSQNKTAVEGFVKEAKQVAEGINSNVAALNKIGQQVNSDAIQVKINTSKVIENLKKTNQDVISSAQAAERAAAGQKGAEAAAREALSHKNAAHASLEKANASSLAAKESAKRASTSELKAKTSETNAENSKNAALEQASAAASSVTEAKKQAAVATQAAIESKSLINDQMLSTDHVLSSKHTIDILGDPFIVSGPVVTCQPVEGYPLSVVSDIAIQQEGKGDPSPNNVRNIIPWTAVNLTHCGKNLLEDVYKTPYGNGVTWTRNQDGSITASGTAVGGAAIYILHHKSNAPLLLPTGEYFVSSNSQKIGAEVRIEGESGTSYRSGSFMIQPGDKIVSVTLNIQPGISVNNETAFPQIEAGQRPTGYEPYHGGTYSVDFGREVCQGVYDWNTGKLTVYSKLFSLRVSEMNNSEAFPGWDFQEQGHASDVIPDTAENLWEKDGQFLNIGLTAGINTKGKNDIIFLPKYEYGMTQTEWKAKYPDLVVQVALPYREDLRPVIQMEPHTIPALPGINTIYADTGDVTVKGVSKPAASLEERIAALEKALTEIKGGI